MQRGWSILYRGPLSSCNYACGYCPFAKAVNTPEQMREDEACLQRFTAWAVRRPEPIGILFTPWGEALIHRAYQRALCQLSHAANIRRVAVQTNLSGLLGWVAGSNPQTLALWCTFHPTQVGLDRFLSQCRVLDRHGIRYSVGVVATKDAFPLLEPLRAGLPAHTYIWLNAVKRDPNYYTAQELRFLADFDPLFPVNNRRHPSLGLPCRTGHTVFSVDGKGDVRRCHFVNTVTGNIYNAGFERALRPAPCPAETCGCHIGYVHLEDLGLEAVFGEGLLERIPANRA